eukprot:gb/GECG01000239.1/.p1 GENE.gb/GECG01000239.1/~~gb/GECG01000239.1/.p1  ORF type:complete len:422 (+),score=53.69 gb/GECG01000239.1/:1-1266(+)
MTTVDELEDAMYSALERNGVLDKLKSTLRAEIFEAMDDKDLPPAPEKPHDTELADELFREYLSWHDYRGTLSVFDSETGRKEQDKQGLSREYMTETLGIQDTARSRRLPLMYIVLSLLKESKYQHSAPRIHESEEASQVDTENPKISTSDSTYHSPEQVSMRTSERYKNRPKFQHTSYEPVIHQKKKTRESTTHQSSGMQNIPKRSIGPTSAHNDAVANPHFMSSHESGTLDSIQNRAVHYSGPTKTQQKPLSTNLGSQHTSLDGANTYAKVAGSRGHAVPETQGMQHGSSEEIHSRQTMSTRGTTAVSSDVASGRSPAINRHTRQDPDASTKKADQTHPRGPQSSTAAAPEPGINRVDPSPKETIIQTAENSNAISELLQTADRNAALYQQGDASLDQASEDGHQGYSEDTFSSEISESA